MKTLRTLIKSDPVYKIFAGMVIAFVLFAVFNVAGTCTGKEVSKTDVAVKLAIDSLNSLYKKQSEQREDSIQREALHRDSLWKIAYDDASRKANKYEKANQKSEKTIQELKVKYAEPCKEIINEYDKRENNYIEAIKAEKVALAVCEKRVVEWKGIAASKETQLTEANNLIKQKDGTITTLKDRNRTIENRMDRNFVFRNWKWVTGRWRKFVLE